MKTDLKERIPHGEVGHFCHGGCAGYAEGGEVEQPMDARARNRQEIGLPATEGGLATLMEHLPGVGLVAGMERGADLRKRLSDPGYLHNTVGRELGTNARRGGPNDTFGKAADVMMMSEGGEVGEKDGTEIPDDVREFIESTHKETRESRPDEGWRIAPAKKDESIAPYKQDEESEAEKGWMALPESVREEGPGPEELPHYDEGGDVQVDPNQVLQEIAPAGTGTLSPSPAQPMQPPTPAPVASAPPPVMPKPAAPPMATAPAAPVTTDQDFMDRANKMLGLNPQEQAGFMKLLGGNAQKAQLGSAVAGIGDAIASGGTLGKVNPGALNKSEELIQGRTNEGLQGLQSIRENQGKAQELADKLEARDPNSPLSKYAQKAYAGIGKKLGLDLSKASAALIGDVSGKGVEALNTEYQNELKMMQLGLQKDTLKATQENQKAERDIARQGQALSATKDLGSRTLGNKIEGIFPGTPANIEKKELEKVASGQKGPVSVNSKAEYDALPAGTHYVDSFGTEKVKK